MGCPLQGRVFSSLLPRMAQLGRSIMRQALWGRSARRMIIMKTENFLPKLPFSPATSHMSQLSFMQILHRYRVPCRPRHRPFLSGRFHFETKHRSLVGYPKAMSHTSLCCIYHFSRFRVLRYFHGFRMDYLIRSKIFFLKAVFEIKVLVHICDGCCVLLKSKKHHSNRQRRITSRSPIEAVVCGRLNTDVRGTAVMSSVSMPRPRARALDPFPTNPPLKRSS